MTIYFSTYSSFHKTYFSDVRHTLSGQKVPKLVLHAVTPPVLASTSSRTKPASRSTFKTQVLRHLLNAVIGLALVVVMFIATPYLYYRFAPAESEILKTFEEGTPVGGNFKDGTGTQAGAEANPTPAPLPPQDPNLPLGNWLIIPRIGVRTELQATADSEKALETGVWMVPEYGRPGAKDKPVILAAHRYGWQWWWKTDYWKYHSFYLLPDLQPGDIVETIVDQRKYTYEIYAGEEGEEISDYFADMILYTCKYLSSPRRHFRYARLVDWSKDSQPQALTN